MSLCLTDSVPNTVLDYTVFKRKGQETPALSDVDFLKNAFSRSMHVSISKIEKKEVLATTTEQVGHGNGLLIRSQIHVHARCSCDLRFTAEDIKVQAVTVKERI